MNHKYFTTNAIATIKVISRAVTLFDIFLTKFKCHTCKHIFYTSMCGYCGYNDLCVSVRKPAKTLLKAYTSKF